MPDSALKPDPTEYAPFYAGYVSLVKEDDVLGVLEAQPAALAALAARTPAERETYRYGPEKWSVRQIFGHLVDGERVFGYRAFCISRGEAQALPGFDEQAYVQAGDADRRALCDLAAEFAAVRVASLSALRRLEPADWRRQGNANGAPVSVRALATIMAGHVRHHLGVLRSRYEVA
ncbi:MAG TPA: DinB family protein [Vicinamibacteria bacterium]|nr:DinB family protein [Vicinamibacteria bacterium]